MIGVVETPAWLNTDWLLGQFASQRRRAIAKYINFVRDGIGKKSLWDELQNQIYLGTESFIKRTQKKIIMQEGLVEVPRAQRRPVAKPLDYYQNRFRDSHRGMVMAYRSGDYSMSAIAAKFGVHYSTVSRAVKEYEKNG